MARPPRRSRTATAALTLLTALAGSAHAGLAATPAVAPACRLAAQQLTARAARLAQTDHGIALLLNSGHYRRAAHRDQ